MQLFYRCSNLLESHRDVELLDAVLGHERHYWQLLVGGRVDADAVLLAFEQALALITLLGGTRTATDTKATLAETPRCEGKQELRERLFDLLRQLYPQDAGVAPLQPDILGERLIARAAGLDDELLDIALARRRDPAGAKHALTVLTRLAQRDPKQQTILSRALDRHLVDHLQQSLEVGSETGAPMPLIIAETVRGKPRSTARQIIIPLLQGIPKDTTNLRELAAAVAQINVEILGEKAKSKRGTKIDVQLVSGLEEAAERFESVGDWTRAAEARRRLFEQTRTNHKSANPGDLGRLCSARGNLATALTRIGDFEQALSHA